MGKNLKEKIEKKFDKILIKSGKILRIFFLKKCYPRSKYTSLWNRVANYDTDEGGSTKIAWIGTELDLVSKNGPHWMTTPIHRDTFGLADQKVVI